MSIRATSWNVLPRGDLGRSARQGRRRPQENPRTRRRRRARRLRLGQVLQRRGLPLPEADPSGLRHQQRRPLHAALPRLVGGSADGRPELRRRDGPVHGRQGRRSASSSSARGRRKTIPSPPPSSENAARNAAPSSSSWTRAASSGASQRYASHILQFKPGADVALLNGMLHTIVEEKLDDQQYIQAHTEGFEALKKKVKDYSPEAMEPVCGIPAATIREVARLYASSKSLDDLLGHGRLAAHPRHRQLPLPDRARPRHRTDRPSGHRPASPARPEQRAGRLRRRPHPDGLSRLQVGRGSAGRSSSTRSSGARTLRPRRASPSSRSCKAILNDDVIKGMYIHG